MGLSHELALGAELRRDDIGTVGLYKTVRATHRYRRPRGRCHAEQLLGLFEREDPLGASTCAPRSACAPIASISTCAATLPPIPGSANDSIASPKFSLIPWAVERD
jgi:hypothetical protein